MVVQLIAKSRAGPRSLPTNFVAQYLRFSTAVPRTYQQTSLVYLLHVLALPSQEGIVCSFSEAILQSTARAKVACKGIPELQSAAWGQNGQQRSQVLSPESAEKGCQRSRPKGPWRTARSPKGQPGSGQCKASEFQSPMVMISTLERCKVLELSLRYQCSWSTQGCIGLTLPINPKTRCLSRYRRLLK